MPSLSPSLHVGAGTRLQDLQNMVADHLKDERAEPPEDIAGDRSTELRGGSRDEKDIKLRGKMNKDGSITLYAKPHKEGFAGVVSRAWNWVTGNSQAERAYARGAVTQILRNTARHHTLSTVQQSSLPRLGEEFRVSNVVAAVGEYAEPDATIFAGPLIGRPQIQSAASDWKAFTTANPTAKSAETGRVMTRLATSLAEDLALELRNLSAQRQQELIVSDGSLLARDLENAFNESVGKLGGFGDLAWRTVNETLIRLDNRMSSDSTTLTFGGIDYQRDRKLAGGTSGEVYLYTSEKDGRTRQLAVKIPIESNFHGRASRLEFRNEYLMHRALQAGGEKYVAKLEGAVRLPDGRLCSVMEYASGGSAKGALEKLHARPFGESETKMIRLAILRDMIEAVRHVHEAKGMMHVDIKPDNFLITADGRAKVTDIGSAKDAKEWLTRLEVPKGTEIYQAPEAVLYRAEMSRGSAPKLTLSQASDVWSLGVSIYQAFQFDKVLPFQARPESSVGEKLNASPLPFLGASEDRIRGKLEEYAQRGNHEDILNALCDDLGDDLGALVAQMLHPDPARRPSLEQVLSAPVFQELRQVDRRETFLGLLA